jgi:hypothetical protein
VLFYFRLSAELFDSSFGSMTIPDILNLLKSIVGIVTFVDIKSFYAVNLDVVSLFVDSSFLVFSGFKYAIISIDVIYQFDWKNIDVFS